MRETARHQGLGVPALLRGPLPPQPQADRARPARAGQRRLAHHLGRGPRTPRRRPRRGRARPGLDQGRPRRRAHLRLPEPRRAPDGARLGRREVHRPDELRSPILTRRSKRPLQGLPPRRLDHVNLMASDVTVQKELFEQTLGLRHPRTGRRLRRRRHRDRCLDERQHPRPRDGDHARPDRQQGPAAPPGLLVRRAAAQHRRRRAVPRVRHPDRGRAGRARHHPGRVPLRLRTRRQPHRAVRQLRHPRSSNPITRPSPGTSPTSTPASPSAAPPCPPRPTSSTAHPAPTARTSSSTAGRTARSSERVARDDQPGGPLDAGRRTGPDGNGRSATNAPSPDTPAAATAHR